MSEAHRTDTARSFLSLAWFLSWLPLFSFEKLLYGPVRTLAESGVGLMPVTGMGMRPYFAFKQSGVEVGYRVSGTVRGAVESYLRDETLPMGEDRLCDCHSESQDTLGRTREGRSGYYSRTKK